MKAYDADGVFLYEYWMASVFESHNGTIYGFEIRELTAANWTSYQADGISYGFASYSLPQPIKTGTSPHTTPIKQYALDAIKIDRVTGTRTLLHSNVDYLFADFDSSAAPGVVKLGLPSVPINHSRLTQRYQVTDDGTVCLRNPLFNHRSILFFDQWIQSTTSRYRIAAAWVRPDGSPSQWTWTNGASSATFSTTATAATIETALETITGVVSATVTGGPLPLNHVDIEIEWTTTTGRFTDIAVQRMNASGETIYSFDGGNVAGRREYTISSGSSDCVTSDNAGIVTSNASRHAISSDSFGAIISNTPVWSVTAISASRTPACTGMTIAPGVIRADHGRVLVAVNRSTAGGTTITHVVLNESTGANIGTADSFMDDSRPYFANSDNIAIWGIDDCGVRMTGGEQYTSIAATGGSASSSWMLQGYPAGFTTTDGFLVNNLESLAVDAVAYPDFAGLLAESLTTAITNTTVTGGDAFFPTKTYIRRSVALSSPFTLYNNTTEWRIVEFSGATQLNATAWFSYSDDETTIEPELQAWYGNNSAGLPTFQITGSTIDNTVTPLMWFQQSGAAFLITATSVTSDVTDHNLIWHQHTYRIELRNANVRFQRALSRVRLSDSVVLWQRDIAGYLTNGPTSGNYQVTYDHGVIVAHSGVARKSATHPTITNGPLP
jgi:hypothetical protein